MDEKIPTWLNKKYLQKALQKTQKYDINIESFEIDETDEKQYHGGIHRIRVKFRSTERNEVFDFSISGLHFSIGFLKFIQNNFWKIITLHPQVLEKCIFVKSTTSNAFIYNFLNTAGAYNKEIDFYSNVAENLHQIMLKIDLYSDIFVKSLHIDRERQALFLADLSPLKYQTVPLRPGLNFDQTKAILCKLAQFHAASAVLCSQNPTIFDSFKHGDSSILYLFNFYRNNRIFHINSSMSLLCTTHCNRTLQQLRL